MTGRDSRPMHGSPIARCGITLLSLLLLRAASFASDAQADPQVAPQANPPSAAPAAGLVVVVGAEGTAEYGRSFAEWADRWMAAASAGQVSATRIGDDDLQATTDRQRLQEVLAQEVHSGAQPLWLVLIGHGTFDGRQARFNLRGEDVSAGELADWLADCRRPLAIINCASASAPFIDRLSGPERIVVTATRSGSEANFSRFGDALSQAVADLSADLDKDGQVSLLEAFLRASRQTQAHYDAQRLLATEHALLDDNGDARGVTADFFSGLRPTTQAEGGEAVDGLRAHQWHLVPSEDERRFPPELRQRRNELELQLARLRDRKDQLDQDAYYDLIEPVLLEIAELYASVDEIDETVQTHDASPATASQTSSSQTSPSQPAASDAAPGRTSHPPLRPARRPGTGRPQQPPEGQGGGLGVRPLD